ncbi:response regulator transcription factor [Psychromonas sp. 14N.309.X.WAT.B.A12]|uniref:response regulator transcription factor n=1 Tax=Psychromonas sp. 14N.309.X.WAT.B.A12 TaxID=2998322 RepID=UPI0025B019F4|nr:response regulator transcription factor [Psychromonas sp. 14N.309.X.WAT.B.A12]MDN2663323.1 response regulator transcription factor [Psychromonas sp. 14N.309.X.WAT.B.A12]
MSNIVVVDTDLESRSLITKILIKASHQVTCLSNSDSVLNLLEQQGADLVIINDCTSSEIIVELIAKIYEDFAAPILLLSEPDKQDTLLEQLRAGADQYLMKPFSANALLVHTDVLLRRVALEKQRANFSHCSQQFSFKISRLPFTDTEEQLVQYLTSKEGDIISKATLQKEVLKKELSMFDRNLDVHISNIRRKMSNAGLSKLHIKTVHGKGYSFSERLSKVAPLLFFFL